jgi:hypothetical protein
MLTQALKELKEEWGFDNSKMNHIQELMEEVASESYIMGYDDRKRDEASEKLYIDIYTSYGKKEDWV